MSVTSAIYAELQARSRKAKPRGIWTTGEVLPDFHLPPPKPQELVPVLQKKFSVCDLLASGVFVSESETPETSPRLNPDLARILDPWLALRRAPDEPPYDILTRSGCLSGRLPALAVLDDHRTRKLLVDYVAPMMLAFTVPDVASLLAAQIPAATAQGLDSLQGNALIEFCNAYDIKMDLGKGASPAASLAQNSNGASQSAGASDQAAAAAPTPADPVVKIALDKIEHPVLVAWSPALGRLEDPGAHELVRTHFARLEKYLEISASHISSWRPTPAVLEKMIFAASHGTNEMVIDILDQSIERDRLSGVPGELVPHTTLAESLASALSLGGDVQRFDQRHQALLDQLDEKVYEQFLKEAEESQDPRRLSDAVSMVGAHRRIHELLLKPLLAKARGQPAATRSREELQEMGSLMKFIENVEK